MDLNRLKRQLKSLTKKENIRIYLWCVVVVIVWRLGLEVINQFAGSSVLSDVKPLTGREYDTSLLRWASWDGGWYKNIVDNGYILKNNLMGPESLAFFPAFPLGAWLISKVTFLNPVYAGLLLNMVATTFVTFLTYKLTSLLAARKKLSKSRVASLAKLSVILVLISPPSFFLIAFYADALLALGLIGAIYFAYKSKMIVSALFAALATGSKSIGVVAIPVLLLISYQESGQKFLEYVKSNFWKLTLYATIALSGILLYMLFLQIRFGDFLLFYKIQKYWESRALPGFFAATLVNVYYRNILSPAYYGGTLGYFYHLNAMLSPLLAGAASIYVLIKDRVQYLWLAPLLIISTIIPLSAGGTVVSANRYFLLCIPPLACYFCAEIITSSKKMEQATPYLIYLSAICMFILTLSFLSSNFAG